ncbi:protein ANTAGONIST OF LIKE HETEROCHROMATIN PROTEIN 1-like [Mizuhopecten yessoensis]|uniref:protein ANTAGONIST OF LIKE HETEROCHROMATIN PROTEIN 1-like n=1 Tax=Mizuhopecten yessoensis TaxID=6573 RepID=UPI000B45B76A|nr:protein ANTAGONIST OF LIKE HETEROCHROMATIN PROTEIN 1-like [Mizuhopecten yessoensis]
MADIAKMMVVDDLLNDDNLYALLPLVFGAFPVSYVAAMRARCDKMKVFGYYEEVVPLYQIDNFKTFFRVERHTFEFLCQQIGEKLQYNNHGGRISISPEKQLCITLWYMGSQSNIHDIADRFGVTDFSVLRCRDRVCKVFLSRKSQIIRRPRRDQLEEMSQNFESKKGFPAVMVFWLCNSAPIISILGDIFFKSILL